MRINYKLCFSVLLLLGTGTYLTQRASKNQETRFKQTTSRHSHTEKPSASEDNKIHKETQKSITEIGNEDLPTFSAALTKVGIPARFLENVSYESRSVTPKDEFPYDVVDAGMIQINFMLTPKKKVCQDTKIVVLVESAVKNFALRQMIRETWGNVKNKPVKVFFLLGLPSENIEEYQRNLSIEATKYKDIVQGSFIDSYMNLTVKSLMALKWTTEYCREAPILFIVDDDVYVALDAVRAQLDKPVNGLLRCGIALWKKAVPRRVSKWAVPPSRYNEKHYPNYCDGPCYIMSQDVVRTLYETSRRTRMDLALEDVMITGILRVKSGIPLNSVVGGGMCRHLRTSDDIQRKMMRAWEKQHGR